jgi:hypothetical protein
MVRSTLNAKESETTRAQLLGEIKELMTEDELLKWAQGGLKKKNTLVEADARTIEIAYRERLDEIAGTKNTMQEVLPDESIRVPDESVKPGAAALAIPKEPVRRRSKAHLLFVRGQTCLICKRSPCDAHHLKFAQPRALGRKVSDEFTVPLCRPHHNDLHRHGNEKSWWANLQVEPLAVARDLWERSPIQINGG